MGSREGWAAAARSWLGVHGLSPCSTHGRGLVPLCPVQGCGGSVEPVAAPLTAAGAMPGCLRCPGT